MRVEAVVTPNLNSGAISTELSVYLAARIIPELQELITRSEATTTPGPSTQPRQGVPVCYVKLRSGREPHRIKTTSFTPKRVCKAEAAT